MRRRGFLQLGLLGSLGFAQGQTPTVTPSVTPAGALQREKTRFELMRVALGKKPADLVILNGILLNTFTAELQPGVAIAISSTRIAAIGDVRRCIGPQTKVVDANGRYLVPGLVDPHYHCESSRVSAP